MTDKSSQTKTLCLLTGGSHLYKLNTPTSDLDERGVFMNTRPEYILGTKRFDEERRQNEDTDKVLKELNHYCSLLRQSNAEAIELLWCDDSEFSVLTPEFCLLRDNKQLFVNSQAFYRCLTGYCFGELRLAIGERTGKLGGKRCEALQKYGFSPKNFTQLFRLMKMGIHFFQTGNIIVNTKQFGHEFWEFIFSVKTEPQLFTADELKARVESMKAELNSAFDDRSQDFSLDESALNDLLLSIYMPVLENFKKMK